MEGYSDITQKRYTALSFRESLCFYKFLDLPLKIPISSIRCDLQRGLTNFKRSHYEVRERKTNIFIPAQVTGGLECVLHSVPCLSAQGREGRASAAALPNAAEAAARFASTPCRLLLAAQ